MSSDKANADGAGSQANRITLNHSNSEISLQKAVTIYEDPEHIEAPTHYDDDPPARTHSPRLHRASITGKKLTGRPAPQHSSSTASLTTMLSNYKLEDGEQGQLTPAQSNTGSADVRHLLSMVTEWLGEEKSKRHARKGKQGNDDRGEIPTSSASDHDLALGKLERILAGFASAAQQAEAKSRRSSLVTRRSSIAKKFTRSSTAHASSDTEWIDQEINVPHVEAFLDNTKTMAFVGGKGDADISEAAKEKDQKNWETFKQDIVRLTHTLKIRGWRRIPIEQGSTILVERLSGALTNAVYVVKPPKDLPAVTSNGEPSQKYVSKSKPLELLLRVYGPHVEHLIDRESELLILRRLAKKRIGPRLLGYFTNGRFEEFLHAQTLTPEDIRIPETSKQIAKRMRELHDGIDLLPSEKEAGPMTFRNWDKWVEPCERVITWLDQQVKLESEGKTNVAKRYAKRGFICGVEWPVFRRTYEAYRRRVLEEYGGERGLRKRLIFAHNDTQYGNLMRLEPPGESPLLQPANQHRQLVVIDFEYASANTVGYEFADHFTEWCYNYHHPQRNYVCDTDRYPTLAEQHRFVRAYVMHRPQFAAAASATPKMEAREKTNISDFMLDARSPGNTATIDYEAEERAREEQMEKEIQELLHEMRLWRAHNSAQWVAWGIIQAKIPELDEPPKKSKHRALIDKVKGHLHPRSDPLDADVAALRDSIKHDRRDTKDNDEELVEGSEEDAEEGGEDFDNLAYSQDRAMFFWGDCLQLGIVKESDLPENLLKRVKLVKM